MIQFLLPPVFRRQLFFRCIGATIIIRWRSVVATLLPKFLLPATAAIPRATGLPADISLLCTSTASRAG